MQHHTIPHASVRPTIRLSACVHMLTASAMTIMMGANPTFMTVRPVQGESQVRGAKGSCMQFGIHAPRAARQATRSNLTLMEDPRGACSTRSITLPGTRTMKLVSSCTHCTAQITTRALPPHARGATHAARPTHPSTALSTLARSRTLPSARATRMRHLRSQWSRGPAPPPLRPPHGSTLGILAWIWSLPWGVPPQSSYDRLSAEMREDLGSVVTSYEHLSPELSSDLGPFVVDLQFLQVELQAAHAHGLLSGSQELSEARWEEGEAGQREEGGSSAVECLTELAWWSAGYSQSVGSSGVETAPGTNPGVELGLEVELTSAAQDRDREQGRFQGGQWEGWQARRALRDRLRLERAAARAERARRSDAGPSGVGPPGAATCAPPMPPPPHPPMRPAVQAEERMPALRAPSQARAELTDLVADARRMMVEALVPLHVTTVTWLASRLWLVGGRGGMRAGWTGRLGGVGGLSALLLGWAEETYVKKPRLTTPTCPPRELSPCMQIGNMLDFIDWDYILWLREHPADDRGRPGTLSIRVHVRWRIRWRYTGKETRSRPERPRSSQARDRLRPHLPKPKGCDQPHFPPTPEQWQEARQTRNAREAGERRPREESVGSAPTPTASIEAAPHNPCTLIERQLVGWEREGKAALAWVGARGGELTRGVARLVSDTGAKTAAKIEEKIHSAPMPVQLALHVSYELAAAH